MSPTVARTSGHGTGGHAPSLLKTVYGPTRRTSATSALRLLSRFGTAESNDSAGIGLGIERHVRNDRITGQALTLDDATVHASVFNRR